MVGFEIGYPKGKSSLRRINEDLRCNIQAGVTVVADDTDRMGAIGVYYCHADNRPEDRCLYRQI